MLRPSFPLFKVFCGEQVLVGRVETVRIVDFVAQTLHIFVVVVQVVVHLLAVAASDALVFLFFGDLEVSLVVDLEFTNFDFSFTIFIIC